MEPISLYEYFSIAMPSFFGVPVVLLLVDQWRYPARVIRLWMAGLGLFLVLFNITLLLTMGPTVYSGLLASLLCPAVCWVCYFICCDYRDGRLVFTLVTGVLALTVIETLANCFAGAATLAGVLLRIGLYIALWLLLWLVLRKRYLRMLSIPGAGWVRMCALPFSLLVCLLSAYVAGMDRVTPYPEPLPPFVLCVAVMVIYVAIYFALTSVQKQYQAERGYDLLHSQMRHLEQQTEQMQASDRDNRTFRHDMRHFITLMQSAAAEGDWATLQKVLSTMGAKVDDLSASYPVRRHTGELVVDSVLALAAARAEKEGVDFTVALTLPDYWPVDITEFAVVISNMLENALTACSTLPQSKPRWIRLTGALQRQQYFLSVANTCDGNIYFDPASNLPVSSTDGHGFGIRSISAFATKYEALLDFHVANEVFTLSMLF